jgi:hypothetical protein
MFLHLRLFAAFVGIVLFSTSSLAESVELPTWLLHTKFGGDFRYRSESTDFEELSGGSTQSFTRHRHRIRFRLGMTSSPSDYTTVGFRLVSGGTSSRSTNQDLAGSFSTKNFMLDRAYLDLHPCKNLSFIFGKAAVPFKSTSQLVWDSDLSIEGISSTLTGKLGTFAATVTAGGFWLEEYERQDDQGMLGIQGSLGRGTENIEWTASVAYFDYQNAAGGALFGSASGNTQQMSGDDGTLRPYYKHDYDLLNFSGTATLPIAEKTKLSLFFEAVENTAVSYDRHGVLGGMKLTSKRGKLPYSFGYSYRETEADATVAALVDSDFADGQTDSNGHELTLYVTPLKELSVGATAFVNKYMVLSKDLTFNRIEFDVIVKF